MSASGKKDDMSQKELQQRREAPLKHGIYSKSMTPEKAAFIATLEEQLSTRPGIIAAMTDQATKALKMTDAAIGYVIKRYQAGVPLDDIPLTRAIPAFLNSAQRSLQALYSMLPDDRDILDIGETIAKAVEEHESQDT